MALDKNRPGYEQVAVRLPVDLMEWVREVYMKKTGLDLTSVIKLALYELRKREGRN